jgi:phosphoserine phosphatase RsbU/P
MLPEQDVRFGPYQFAHGVTPSLYLSGDFVDYFKINDSKFGFYIADVSGHGASSAFVTVLLKSLIALALTRYQIHDETAIMEPDKLLTIVGREIHAAKLGKYLTIVYAVMDLENHQLTYSIGGHYPNPILVENKNAHFLEGKGFPVGIMKDAKYENRSITIPVNGQLVMFSDGITEILPEKELVEKEKTILSMTAASDGTVDYFLNRLNLKEKRALPDDVTMLILKRVS